MFVHGNQAAHIAGVDLIHQDEGLVGRLPAGCFVRNQLFDTRLIHTLRFGVRRGLRRGFAAHKGFCLGEDVVKQDFVVSWAGCCVFRARRWGRWVWCACLGAAVGSSACWPTLMPYVSAPEVITAICSVSVLLCRQRNLFAVAFHVELLDGFGQAVEVLVVRCDDVASAAVLVDVRMPIRARDGGQVALRAECWWNVGASGARRWAFRWSFVRRDASIIGGPMAGPTVCTGRRRRSQSSFLFSVWMPGSAPGFLVSWNSNEMFVVRNFFHRPHG